jgi:hypothetical protein
MHLLTDDPFIKISPKMNTPKKQNQKPKKTNINTPLPTRYSALGKWQKYIYILKSRIQNNTQQNLTSNSKPNFRAHLITSILLLPTIPHFVLLFLCLFVCFPPSPLNKKKVKKTS